MLRIYYGRESVDKAQFIFDNAGTKALVLVPDQFTLEAEREAIRCLGADGLMDSEILSISRLGFRMLSEVGGIKKSRIDKYGRHIILTSVINELSEKGELKAYGRLAGRASFTELVNNFISGLKQHGAKPMDLVSLQEKSVGTDILSGKLSDIAKIFEGYEERISGKFLDTEDYIDMYMPAVSALTIVRGREIWVWGFDSFAPKTEKLIGELIKAADVNIVMTSSDDGRDKELFGLTRNVMKRLSASAKAEGISCECLKIEKNRDCDKEEEIDKEAESVSEILERELFAIPVRTVRDGSNAGEKLTLVAAANYYNEAETAAAYVKQLVRDKGLKYKDILLVCNDLEGRAEIIRRVFAEYGMEIFTDEKGGVLEEPLVVYVLSLIEIMTKGYRSKDVLGFLKTGLTPISKDRVETLENYTLKYRVQGSSWKKPFEYGRLEYGDEEFGRIEETRKQLIALIESFEESFKSDRSVEKRASALYGFLISDSGPAKTVKERDDEQVWDAVMLILDQIVNVSSGEKVSMETFGQLLKTGFEAVEVGKIPPSADGLVLGTMQRTRTGRVKALVVIGANDGVLPKENAEEELLSEDEKQLISDAGFDICTLDRLRIQEEKIAVYRTMSKATDYVYMSYSGSDTDGNELKPSRIFTTVRRIFPNVPVETDLDGRDNPAVFFESRDSALNHLICTIRKNAETGESDGRWEELAHWYLENDAERFKHASEGLFYTNRTKNIGDDVVRGLYRMEEKSLTVSPSRLERYSRCPFSHFVNYGLRPDEKRVFEAAAREIGDVYHECLMVFSQRMAEQRTDGNRGFDVVTREESDRILDSIINEIAAEYREGLMLSGDEESYRKSRMGETLKEAAWSLVMQARSGNIQDMFFEEAFGRDANKSFNAIEVKTRKGTVYIEGKIDRVDILQNGSVKIIDYKSGNEKWNTEETRYGWRLQLMLYLKAAETAKDGSIRKPAGIFYFLIKDADINADGIDDNKLKEAIGEGLLKEFKMNGLAVDGAGNIENIERDMDGPSNVVSNLRKLKKPTDGRQYSGAVMTEDEFTEFCGEFEDKITELCSSLLSGEIAARPKRVGDVAACRYCSYKSICRFEAGLPGCSYEKVL